MENTNYIFGTFDGQNMVGDDNNIYPIPSNYASKSKLVEGDKLKLQIDENGQFIYKQVERQVTKRVRGIVEWVGRECCVFVGAKRYKVLLTAATYFKLDDGDEAILLVPLEHEDVTWAAVENVIKLIKDDDKELDLND